MFTRIARLFAVATVLVFALSACGGGGGDSAPEPAPPPPAPTPTGEPVALPEGHTLSGGAFEVAAGANVDRGGVRFTCAAGGAACQVVVNEDGAARSTGGELTVAKVMPPETPAPPAGEPVALPDGHTPSGGAFEVAAGANVDRGGVRFSCAAGGAACQVVVDAAGAARSTGGALTVAKLVTPAPPAPSIDWPAWLVMDVARAQSLLGGSVLDWGTDKVRAEVYRILHSNIDGASEDYPARFGEGVSNSNWLLNGSGQVIIRYDDNGNLAAGQSFGITTSALKFIFSRQYESGCSFEDSISTCGRDDDRDTKVQYRICGQRLRRHSCRPDSDNRHRRFFRGKLH